jgi:hypothetical protein
LTLITREEYEILKERFGDNLPHVAITNRHKKGARKKRYIEESRKVMKLLKEIRES